MDLRFVLQKERNATVSPMSVPAKESQKIITSLVVRRLDQSCEAHQA